MIRWAVRQPTQILLIAVSGSSSVRRAIEQSRKLQTAVDELRRSMDGIITAAVLRPPKRQGLHDHLAHVLVLDQDLSGKKGRFAEEPQSLSRSSPSAWPADGH